MEPSVHVKAPGKVLWLGGYSVLEKPSVGFVTTIDSFVHAYVKQTGPTGTIAVKAPHMDSSAVFTLSRDTHKLEGDIPAGLGIMGSAISVSSMFLSALGVRIPGLEIETKNDRVMSYSLVKEGVSHRVSKSGFGSSAAVTVATVAGMLSAAGAEVQSETVHKLSQLSHSLATGKVGSGFDIAAATHGSIVYERYSPDIIRRVMREDLSPDSVLKLVKNRWDYRVRKVQLPRIFSTAFAGFANGGASTSAMVKSVLSLKERNPEVYWKLIRGINASNASAISALESMNSGVDAETAASAFKRHFDEGRALTKRLGEESGTPIEPEECTALISESCINGAYAAKLPGAGGMDMIAALCTSAANKKRLLSYWSEKRTLVDIDVAINNNGFQAITT